MQLFYLFHHLWKLYLVLFCIYLFEPQQRLFVRFV